AEGGIRDFHVTGVQTCALPISLEGAALLARCAIRHAITTRQALHQRIRNLPISSLELDPAIVRSLHQAGVRTIGLLLDLPRDAQIGSASCRASGDVAVARAAAR